MRAAHLPVQRHPNAKLMAVDAGGRISHLPAARIASVLRPGDLLVANDAATLPADEALVDLDRQRDLLALRPPLEPAAAGVLA